MIISGGIVVDLHVGVIMRPHLGYAIEIVVVTVYFVCSCKKYFLCEHCIFFVTHGNTMA